MSIKTNLDKIVSSIPEHVSLVAISKTKPNHLILEAYHVGQRLFGENKVQELCTKYETLPHDIEWHFIGHLQTNKVKYIAPFIQLIHAVDSLNLLKEINKQAAKNNRIINCLLQFHVATEDTKFGMDISEAKELLESADYKTFNNIQICGIMGMASYSSDESLIRCEFKQLKSIFDFLKKTYFIKNDWFKEISMGMSNDFLIAIQEGSTMVRIGTTIFGNRTI